MSAKIQPLRPSKPPPRRLDLAPVIADLRHSRDISHNIRLGGKVTEVPSAASIAEALEGIVTSLFPTHLGPHGLSPDTVDHFVRNTLSTSFDRLGDQIGRGLQFDSRGLSVQDAQKEADVILDGLAQRLPEVRGLLKGVTLGEAEMPKASGIARRPRRHPVIEDNVVIHAGASILGRITVGAGSIIGGNVWLTRSVPPGSTVTQAAHDFGAISCLD